MLDLYDWLLWMVIWFMGAVYGWYARERHAKRTIDRFVTQFVDEEVEAVKDSIIPITIEKHNGGFLVFNKETHEFMAQGGTRRQLEDALAKRFPDKRFTATTENLKVFNESL
jgi:hypothetical protein